MNWCIVCSEQIPGRSTRRTGIAGVLRFAYPLALRSRSALVSSPSTSLTTRVVRAFRLDEQATDAAGWAFNLAVFRIVYLTAGVLPLAIDTFQWTRHALPGLHLVLWQPVSFFRWLPLGVIADPGLGQALAAILVGLVVLGALGVRTRLVLGLATVVALYVLGLPQNLGKVHHHHNAVWFLAILAASPSGAVLSVDAVIRRRRGEDAGAPGGALAALRYVWALMAAIYLFPGLAKLVAAVVDGWASAEHQRLVLWNKWWQLEWYGSYDRSAHPGGRPAGLRPDRRRLHRHPRRSGPGRRHDVPAHSAGGAGAWARLSPEHQSGARHLLHLVDPGLRCSRRLVMAYATSARPQGVRRGKRRGRGLESPEPSHGRDRASGLRAAGQLDPLFDRDPAALSPRAGRAAAHRPPRAAFRLALRRVSVLHHRRASHRVDRRVPGGRSRRPGAPGGAVGVRGCGWTPQRFASAYPANRPSRGPRCPADGLPPSGQ